MLKLDQIRRDQDMRINKLLSNYGYCSRKKANEWIREGRIHVNGSLATEGQWVEEYDEISLDGDPVRKKDPLYIALNKPPGIICTREESEKDNIINFMGLSHYLFPVGRLDKDSEGLILLTNDGDTANLILESENIHEKEYLVTVDKEINDAFIRELTSPMDIRIGITRACHGEKLSPFTFRIVLTQGMNRQIRRMCSALGYQVLKLERIRILSITLDGLPQGAWRHLHEDELMNLRALLR